MFRKYFGMSACWTQDGVSIFKYRDKNRHEITSTDELKVLMLKTSTNLHK